MVVCSRGDEGGQLHFVDWTDRTDSHAHRGSLDTMTDLRTHTRCRPTRPENTHSPDDNPFTHYTIPAELNNDRVARPGSSQVSADYGVARDDGLAA